MNKKQKVYDTVLNFMREQGVTSADTIHQCEWVMENAYEFLTELFLLVQHDLI